ncbi:MAG: 4Fe-4S dicluster domain-containing protein [Bacteroidetes bacterium]|nr:4Fe-4S dicluster domain-containing protein [Bacteroidota bacterium]
MSHRTFTITHENLLDVLTNTIAVGNRLVAPVRRGKKLFFRDVQEVQSIVFDFIQSDESPKDLVFPRVEPMLAHEYNAGNVYLIDFAEKLQPLPTILFGTRPCDAVALSLLIEFFNEGVGDPFVEQRAENLTIISIACTRADSYCFCTSVGVSPNDSRGSDVLLTPIDNDQYYGIVLTEKGNAFVKKGGDNFIPSEPKDVAQYIVTLREEFTPQEITQRLANAFNHPLWMDASLRCIGCGTCTYVCPLCSCFDIQDEGTQTKGVRLRCWDSCGFSLFTLHTSGHNPRHIQSERWRQRVMHKFSYIPQNRNLLGCVGCGRCSRLCPADMNLKEHLCTITKEMTEVKADR